MSEFTEEQFIELVKRSEAAAEKNINTYKIKLALFAVLGYFVIFFVVAALVLLVGGTLSVAFLSSSIFLLLIKKKIIFAILLAIWVFLKALWVKFDPPEGYVLERKKFPQLFKEIDELSKTLKALKIHQVIIEDNLNAAVVQHPKYGILGGQRNTLFLGIQLLLALSPKEMRSVLAHEFGHLSGNHSRFSGWIYRVRVSWFKIMNAFEGNDSFGAGMMRRFFNWYAPKFSAYSFALARSNEYEADQVAAELTSPEIAAKALVNVHAQVPYIDREFWDAYFIQADEMPEPPTPPYEGLAEFLKNSPISREKLLGTIKQEMQEETHYADTHPALRERVEAITRKAVLPDIFAINSAEVWLGEGYREVLSHFDQAWMERNGEQWENRYKYVALAKSTLEASKDIELDSLSDDELWNLSQYRDEFEGDNTALPAYQCFQQRYPDSPGAAYYIGRIFAARKDEMAIQHLRIAINDPNVLEQAGNWGYQLLKEKGKEQEAEQWWEEVLQVNEAHRIALAEYESVSLDDEFKSPTIEEPLLQEIVEQLKAHKNAGASWLAEKVLQGDGSLPVYVIVFRPRGFYWSFEAAMKSVATDLKLDADYFVVSLWGDTRALGKKIKKAGIKIS